MLFNTIDFLIFLILVFALFWIVAPRRPAIGKIILFVSSYIFYGWWDWRFLILIAFSSGSDFLIGKFLFRTESEGKRKFLLYLKSRIPEQEKQRTCIISAQLRQDSYIKIITFVCYRVRTR